ncbi:MAG: hypothetical protein ACREDR_17245, partial [Blastocatellia bacterium]
MTRQDDQWHVRAPTNLCIMGSGSSALIHAFPFGHWQALKDVTGGEHLRHSEMRQDIRKGAMDMNTRERSTRNNGLAILACLVGIALFERGFMARAYAGQSKAGESANQEFLDSIRKGDLPKVKELFQA